LIPKDLPAGRANAPEIYAGRPRRWASRFTRAPACLDERAPRRRRSTRSRSELRFPGIGYGRDYTGKPINGDKTAQDGMEQPVYFWTPDIAPAGIAFYTGTRFPAWQGDLFVSALAGKSLVRLVLKDDRVIGEERLLTELNVRIRGVNEGPDGALYVLTDGLTGKIIRLVPRR
jgi:glucose/arabinose dehydrogenase